MKCSTKWRTCHPLPDFLIAGLLLAFLLDPCGCVEFFPVATSVLYLESAFFLSVIISMMPHFLYFHAQRRR
jgi:hypothetical protein